jgi:hypothetical protein
VAKGGGKGDQKALLNRGRAVPESDLTGWEAAITGGAGAQEPPTSSQPAYQNKTYLLRPDQVTAIAELAEDSGAKVNEFVRAALDHLIEEIRSGRLEIEVGSTQVRRRR